MKILVTGGAGFIGKHLSEFLLNKGNEVTIYDNFSNSLFPEKLNELQKNLTVIKGDVTDYVLLEKTLNGFDTVFHLAAKISVPESIKNPEETYHTNVTGTQQLVRACIKNNVKKFVFASTAAVYGNVDTMPISEISPATPLSPYGKTKLASEQYLQEIANSNDFNCISLRFFNVYGSGQSPEYAGVISEFISRILQGKAPIIFGDGSATRDFLAIDDVLNGLECALSNINGKKGNAYNIASGQPISIKELAYLIISISGKNLKPEFAPEREGDILHSQADISLAKKELEFSPKVKLRDGLESLYNNLEPNIV